MSDTSCATLGHMKNPRRRAVCGRCKKLRLHYTAMKPPRKKRQLEYPCIQCRKERQTTFKSGSPEYRAWFSMHARCGNPDHKSYPGYGGRGIVVCEAWGEFDTFLRDMGRRRSHLLSLDRINNDKGYSPENCRWATSKTQNRNRRDNRRLTLNGVTKTATEWADELDINRTTLAQRKRRGWSDEKALTTSSRNHRPKHVTENEKQEMQRLWGQGWSAVAIAENFSVSRGTVYLHVG